MITEITSIKKQDDSVNCGIFILIYAYFSILKKLSLNVLVLNERSLEYIRKKLILVAVNVGKESGGKVAYEITEDSPEIIEGASISYNVKLSYCY